MHLVHDIKNRKDDYAAQLSSLTLAEMSKSSGSGDSEQEIIASIFAPQNLQKEGEEEEKELKLWQARLVLKIGEVLDQEEEEIAGQLAVLKDEQERLFKNLQGEGEATDDEENPFAELSQLTEQLGASHHGNARKRYRAWKTLFLESSLNSSALFLTTNPDNGDLLQESYEEQSGRAAVTAGSLALPAIIGWDYSEASTHALDFHDTYSEEITELTRRLKEMSQEPAPEADGTDLQPLTSQLFSRLQNALDREFPTETHGRIQATLYVLPGLSGAALLGHKNTGKQEITNGLLLVVS